MAEKASVNPVFFESTFYCDHTHPGIKALAEKIEKRSETPLEYIRNVFFHVRDTIRFGADVWQVKASQTLSKGYGACYNKNLLMIALLRNQFIACRLMANPMKNSFTRPSIGNLFKTLSNPFYHCFSEVLLNNQWIHLDPTLDIDTYHTYFKPMNLGWSVDWDENGMRPLYSESIMGESVTYMDIDQALKNNLNSYFLFRFEPNFILNWYAKIGNFSLWKGVDRMKTTAAAPIRSLKNKKKSF